MFKNLINVLHLKGSSNNPSNQKDSKEPDQNNKTKIPNTPKKKRSLLTTILWIAIASLVLILLFSLIFGQNVKDLTREQIIALFSANPGQLDGVKIYFQLYSDVFYLQLNISKDIVVSDNSVAFAKGVYGTYWPYAWRSFMLLTSISAAGPDSISVLVPTTPLIIQILVSWLPWILFFVLGWFIIKMVIDKQSNQMGFGKNQAKPEISNVKFDDVAGYEEIKTELRELVDFLKMPEKFSKVGARTPKGVLLAGPPGTGKTLFAKAIAGEAQIPFFSISGSDFVEMFVGVGASRVRSLFKAAKAAAPALIFIDELDAVGRRRGSQNGGSNDEREQTLNQLLVEMDGFVSNSGVIIIAATNRADVLDPALKRPGRFDREIQLRLPDIRERAAILSRHAKGKTFSPNIRWENIAKRTPGFSGAELENVLNEAAILSIRLDLKEITLIEIDEAIDRVMGGPSKPNNVMSLEEKKLISYHEAGHALIGLILEHAQKVQKISIVPRGDAGGYVLMTPKKEKIIQTKSELIATITSYMGGRASEEIFFGKEFITTGAYSDIEESTKIARRMINEFGMSSLGPIQFNKMDMYENYNSSQKQISNDLQSKIDEKISILISDAYKHAYKIISENQDLIHIFAEALMLKENLNSEEIEELFRTKKIPQEFYSIQENKEKIALFKVEEFDLGNGTIIFSSPEEIDRIKKAIALRMSNNQQNQNSQLKEEIKN